MAAPLKAFISATSIDLKHYRQAVRDTLLAAEILPIVQEHFPPDYRTLEEFLQDRIIDCDVIICIVGHELGSTTSININTLQSYSQLEYDIAYKLQKPIYVFIADVKLIKTEKKQNYKDAKLQYQHREMLMARHKCEFFSSVSQLRQKILQIIPKLQDLAKQPMFYLHPPSPPTYFVGRSEELAQLSVAVQKDYPSIIAIVGMGGQGKTTLLYQWIRSQKSLKFAKGFWCSANRRGFTFDMFLDEVLIYLMEKDFDKRNSADVNSRITQVISELQRRPTLLIIDGVEHWLKGWNQGMEDIETEHFLGKRQGFYTGLDSFLHESSGLHNGTHLILTTRALPAVLDQVICTIVPVYKEPDSDLSLRGLDPKDSVSLLQSLGVIGEKEQLQQIASRYAYHPLAITVLGRVVSKKYGGSLVGLPDEPIPEPHKALFNLFEEVRHHISKEPLCEALLLTASLSIEAAQLNAIAAAMDKTSISEDYLRDRAVILSDWHLVKWNGKSATLELHPLVKQYFSQLFDSEEIHRIHQRYSKWYQSQPITSHPVTLHDVKTRILAIEHAILANDEKQCAILCFSPINKNYTFPEWLSAWGHQSTGIELFNKVAEISSLLQGSKYLVVQAGLMRQIGKFQEAEKSLNETIQLLRASDRIHRDHIIDLIGGLINRGNVLRQLAKFHESISDFNDALQLMEQITEEYPDYNEEKATVLLNRGVAFRERGEFTNALLDYKKSVQLYQHFIDDNKKYLLPKLINALINQGIVESDLHMYKESLKNFENAEELVEDLLSNGNQEIKPFLLQISIMKAGIFQKIDQNDEALQILNHTMPTLKGLINSGRKDLESLYALGWFSRSKAYLNLRKWLKALESSNEAINQLKILIEAGRNDKKGWLAHALFNRSTANFHLRRIKDSANDRKRAIELINIVIGHGEPEIRVLLLKKAVEATCYLLEKFPEEGISFLDYAISETELGLNQGEAVEALQLESKISLKLLVPFKKQLKDNFKILKRLKHCSL